MSIEFYLILFYKITKIREPFFARFSSIYPKVVDRNLF